MRGVHGGVGETHDPVRDVDRLAARGDIAEAGVQVDVRHRRPHLKADPDRPDHLKNAGLGVAGEGKNIRSGFQAAVVGGPADKPTAVPAMGGVGSGRQVGVLHPAAPRRGHRRAGGTRAGPACRRVPRAGLHASGGAYNRVPPAVTAFVHRRQIEQVGCLTAAAETRRFWADLPVGEAGAGHRPRTRCRAALRTRRPSRLVDLAGCANRSWLRTDSSWLR
jgi:hypothetical protein